jgi:hypothetical protein
MLRIFKKQAATPHGMAVKIGNQLNEALPGDDAAQMQAIATLMSLWGRFDLTGNRLSDAAAAQRIGRLVDAVHKT